MVGRTVSHYRVLALVGSGGMGTVYRAEDTRLGRPVALKFLPEQLTRHPQALERFQREARAVSALNHPNICTLYDIDAADDRPFLVLELLEGESLEQRLRSGRLSTTDLVDLAMQIADALGAAHAKGIVHRDIKPANVFITARGTAKLLDFGLAKPASEPREAPAGAATAATGWATGAGLALGTVGYMSPEQVRGEALDTRTDLFSLGVTLYQMATGTAPFRGPTSGRVLSEILTRTAVPPSELNPDVPAELGRIIDKALEKDRELRYQSAREMLVDLTRLRRALGVPPGSASVPIGPARGSLSPVDGERAKGRREDASIVVLPFENLSPDPENAFFADGLTEELIADLSKVRALRVISRTSAMLLKGSKKDLPTIARELGVRYALEGSVRRAGQSLRMTAQLIDAGTDAHLWAETYGGTLDDVFAIQEKVSHAIVEALKVTLTADERHRLAARVIHDVKAFDLYLEARRDAYQGLTEAALDRAVRLTRRALDLAGPNALLYALLAEIEFLYHDQGMHRDEESLRRGESWARRALEIEPETAAAFQALGAIEARRGDMVRAIRDLRRANELQTSGETLCFLAWRCSEVGEMAEARRYATQAVAVDPLLWFCHWSEAWVALLDGDFEAAHGRWREAITSTAEPAPIATFFLAVFSAYAGRLDEACHLFHQFADAGLGGVSLLAAALEALFRRDAKAAAGLLENRALEEYATMDKEMSWWLAAGCTFAGEMDQALRWLGNAIDLGFVNCDFFSRIDPFLEALRGDPRFEALMERAREKQRAFGVQ